jgi:amino acid transporter
MELITPDFGLIFWMIISGLLIILWILTLVNIISSSKLTNKGKIAFSIIVIAMPVLGTILYFSMRDKSRIYRQFYI